MKLTSVQVHVSVTPKELLDAMKFLKSAFVRSLTEDQLVRYVKKAMSSIQRLKNVTRKKSASLMEADKIVAAKVIAFMMTMVRLNVLVSQALQTMEEFFVENALILYSNSLIASRDLSFLINLRLNVLNLRIS